MNWYAVFVKTGEEKLVEQIISKRLPLLRCVVPQRKLYERIKGRETVVVRTLFPGYIFINAEIDSDVYYSIRAVPFVHKILGCGQDRRRNTDGYYTKIREEEFELILRLVGNEGIIGFSEIIKTDKKITIHSGPLTGLEGIIVSVNMRKKRAKIAIELLDDTKLVDVGIERIC